jgi:hypothetical protein
VFAATCSSWFLAHRLFYPEDGGDTFLLNIGSHKIYIAPHCRENLKSYKTSSVSEWHRWFKGGPKDVQDDPRRGQPKTQRTDANVDRVQPLVHSDRRLGVRLTAEELNMKRETVRQIITEDLGMRQFFAKMVTRILTNYQKLRLHISFDLLNNAEIFDGVIISDETWCFQYDRETKCQSMQLKTQN